MSTPNLLGQYIHQVRRFTGKVDGFSIAKKRRKICVQSLYAVGNPQMLRTHVWIELSQAARSMNLQKGDVIEFTGRVETYLRHADRLGYRQARVQHGIVECGGFRVVSSAGAVMPQKEGGRINDERRTGRH